MKRPILLILWAIFIFLASNCQVPSIREELNAGKIDTAPLMNEFKFSIDHSANTNNGLRITVYGKIDNSSIKINLPPDVQLNGLIATFTVNSGNRVTIGEKLQESGITPNIFSSPITYTVTSSNGKMSNYTIEIEQRTNIADTNKSLVLSEVKINWMIDGNDKQYIGDIYANTITFRLPWNEEYSNDKTEYLKNNLVFKPELLRQVKYDIVIVGDSANTFTIQFKSTVNDGTDNDVIIAIYKCYILTDADTKKEISDFQFLTEKNDTITEDSRAIISGSTINVGITPASSVRPNYNLIPTFTLTSSLATVIFNEVEISSGETVSDFSLPLKWIVTAQDGSTKEYEISVFPGPAITSFIITKEKNPQFEEDIIGKITRIGTSSQIKLHLSSSLNQNITPTFTVYPVGSNVKIDEVQQESELTPISPDAFPIIYSVENSDNSASVALSFEFEADTQLIDTGLTLEVEDFLMNPEETRKVDVTINNPNGLNIDTDFTLIILKPVTAADKVVTFNNDYTKLIISNRVAASDAGTYTIVATGKGQYTGAVTAEFRLTVLTIPEKVTGVAAKDGAGKVSLSWNEPYDGGTDITEYTIYYSENEDFSNDIYQSVSHITEIEIPLDPGKYFFKVTATNSKGEGEKSEQVTGMSTKSNQTKTGLEFADFSENDTTVVSGTGGSIPIAYTTGNSPDELSLSIGTDFILSIESIDSTSTYLSIDDTGEYVIVDPGVVTGGEYTLMATGTGQYTGTVEKTFTLTVKKPITGTMVYNSGKPISVLQGTEDAFSVNWSGVTDSNQSVIYSIEPTTDGISIGTNGSIAIEKTANVQASTDYTVRATGTLEYGGPPIQTTLAIEIIEDKSLLPGEPTHVTALNTGNTGSGEVLLSWIAPLNTGKKSNGSDDTISEYKVYYSNSNDFSDLTADTVTEVTNGNVITSLSYTVTNLNPGAILYFAVSAVNSKGEGSPGISPASVTIARAGQHVVTYESGSTAILLNITSETVDYNSIITEAPIGYTKSGFTLYADWNTEADGTGTLFVFGTSRVTEDMTLYARWKTNDTTSNANGLASYYVVTTRAEIFRDKAYEVYPITMILDFETDFNFEKDKKYALVDLGGNVFGTSAYMQNSNLYIYANSNNNIDLEMTGVFEENRRYVVIIEMKTANNENTVKVWIAEEEDNTIFPRTLGDESSGLIEGGNWSGGDPSAFFKYILSAQNNTSLTEWPGTIHSGELFVEKTKAEVWFP